MKLKLYVLFLLIVGAVVGGSLISVRIWQEKPETADTSHSLEVVITEQMTARQIAEAYGLSEKAVKKPLGLKSPDDLNKTVSELGLNVNEIPNRLKGAIAISAEESSKNWFKIPLKFSLWIIFLIIVFRMIRSQKVTPTNRKILLLIAIVLFGVILGSDPSPMGTVKDAIALWGKEHVVFPPRMIALTVFLLMVVFANKYICSWGCQFGVLQEFIFRLNRNKADKSALTKQWKLPFALMNTIRVIFFAVFCVAAVLWATDIISYIDPFKIYNPAVIGSVGIAFISLLLIASLFIYRPWCHLFCPFGLVGWLFEKLSVYKIKVDYDKCIACGSCSEACPSTVMNAILKQETTIPDCFTCGTCQSVCPTSAISFDKGARVKPPLDKFKK